MVKTNQHPGYPTQHSVIAASVPHALDKTGLSSQEERILQTPNFVLKTMSTKQKNQSLHSLRGNIATSLVGFVTFTATGRALVKLVVQASSSVITFSGLQM